MGLIPIFGCCEAGGRSHLPSASGLCVSRCGREEAGPGPGWRGGSEALSLPLQVAETLQGLLQALPCITFTDSLWTMMKVVMVLGAQHTQETVEVMLSLCHPSER